MMVFTLTIKEKCVIYKYYEEFKIFNYWSYIYFERYRNN
jgi:hypothetical protein